MAIESRSGSPTWQVTLTQMPLDVDCEMLDCNGSGLSDCLITGEDGLLACLEASSGHVHWYSDVHTYPRMPLPMSDIDSDGIDDLVSVEMIERSRYVVLVSGRTGKLILRRPVTNCHDVVLNSIDSTFELSYSCVDKPNEREY